MKAKPKAIPAAKLGRPKSALVALRKRFLAYRKAKGLK